jgi:hypothetical protein
MGYTWEKDLYKPLNMVVITIYPNTMPKGINKWFPNLSGNNLVTVEHHFYVIGRDMEKEGVEHEDFAMRLLPASLIEDVKRWFDSLPGHHVATYEDFAKLFISIWPVKKDSGMLMNQFNR